MADQEDLSKPKTESEKVQFWQERINIAKKELEDWRQKSGADRFIDEYNGKWQIYFQGLRGKIPVPPINRVFAFVQTDLSNIYNRDPYISVNPKAGTVRAAKLWEVLLNYDWRELKVKAELESEYIDKDLVGYGFHKTGYSAQTEGSGELLKLTSEKFYSSKVDWKDVVWNLGAKKVPDDCTWMAQRITRPLYYWRSRYKAAKGMEGIKSPEISDDTYKNSAYKDDIKVGIAWEIWDSESKQILLVGEDLKHKWLAPSRPWPEYQDEFPFLMYWDYESPNNNRPQSAIASWEHMILSEMVLTAQAINHSKRWNRQLFVNAGAIDEGSLDKFERGDDGAIIINNGQGKLDENMKFADFGQMPVDFYILIDRLRAIQDEINGQPAIDRGGTTKTPSRTIGELNLVAEGSKGRTSRKQDRFETHIENIARHMMAHRKANFDFEEVVKVIGETPEEVVKSLGNAFDPVTQTVRITPQDIQGEFDVEVKAGSTLPLNKETKMQILEIIITNLARVQSVGVSPLMNVAITEMLEGFDIKSLKEAWVAEQQVAQQRQRIQGAQTYAESQKAESQAKKNIASAEKISTESDVQLATTIDELINKQDENELSKLPQR